MCIYLYIDVLIHTYAYLHDMCRLGIAAGFLKLESGGLEAASAGRLRALELRAHVSGSTAGRFRARGHATEV